MNDPEQHCPSSRGQGTRASCRGITEVIKDSGEEQAGQVFTADTLDSWTWILRARDAARRALEPATPQLVHKAEPDAQPREPLDD